MQEDAFRNTASSADAFGMGGGGSGMEGVPTPTTYAGGVRGYSSAPLFEESMSELQSRSPGQYAAINAPFIDPVTGASPDYPYKGSTAVPDYMLPSSPPVKSGGGGGCVVATHAVNSGAFSPATKREAVVWCMNVLHGKWWGEAVRRGYRHCGNKKIEQGKARAHYGEFRRYIDFASGKKRTLRGAVTFTLRTAQFFAVGLVKKDA
tara:strand:- start:1571 stop:2188 length:618 start_codon:yes stop_codon:yes gene_type:complete